MYVRTGKTNSSSKVYCLCPERLLSSLLLHKLHKRGVDLGVILAVVLLVVAALGLLLLRLLAVGGGALLRDHDDRGRALRLGGGAELGAGGDEDVGDVVVLAEDGEVGDYVHGGDVAGDDDDAREGGVSGSRSGGLAEGLDDFFYAALEGVVLGGCWGGGYVSL